MNVSLTPELETLVKNHVKTGRYHSSSEVIREALRVWEEQEQLREIRRNQLQKDIQAGLKSGDATPLDFEDIKTRGRTRLKQASKDR
jgi:antitoxin ParD1/3/4